MTGHHRLHSFLLEKALTKRRILSCIHFIKQQFGSFEERLALPMKPMMNGVRWNFATPQAIRIFFSKSPSAGGGTSQGGATINRGDNGNNDNDDDNEERFFHGAGGLMTSMGPHPRKFRVFPVKGFLETLLADVSGRVEKLLKTKTRHTWDGRVSFDSLEIKAHFGQDIFEGIKWVDGKSLSVNSNNKIGQHVDCQFLVKEGEVVQASSDSADGRHPIATITIGSARDLIFSSQE